MREPGRLRRPSRKFYIALGYAQKLHCLAVRPWMLWLFALSAPFALSALGAFGALSIQTNSFQTTSLAAQEADLRADYEDRLASMRMKMDELADKSARQKHEFESKARALAARQARLDQRAAEIVKLVATSQPGDDGRLAAETPSSVAERLARLAETDQLQPLPRTAQAVAPMASAHPGTASNAGKPRPGAVVIRSDREKTSALAPDPMSDPSWRLDARLAAMNSDVRNVEAKQVEAMARLASSIEEKAAKVRLALAKVGLSARRVALPAKKRPLPAGVGGPFVPVKFDPDASPFDDRLARLQSEITQGERILKALPYLPFRQPLQGKLVTTSPFGERVDPFLGVMAMHTGNDFRGAFGSPVAATAAGKVVWASYDGGYGNMVEIDHGHGLTTRYAHLSAILVMKGQKVAAGQEVGRLGSTGRSTGPHLHYEVRIDGKPVNPLPFVNAGESLFASK